MKRLELESRSPESSAGGGSRKKVLPADTQPPVVAIVEPDSSLREAMRRVLESAGFHATGFLNAEEFLGSDAVGLARCLILDLYLPGLSGLQLQAKLRAEGCTTPALLMVNAGQADGLGERAIPEGFVGVLYKPFHHHVLLDLLALVTDAPPPVKANLGRY